MSLSSPLPWCGRWVVQWQMHGNSETQSPKPRVSPPRYVWYAPDIAQICLTCLTCTEDKIVNHRRAFSSFLRRWTSHTHTFFLCLRYHLTFWAILYLLNFWKMLYTFSQYFRWFSSLSSLFIWNGRSMARGVKLPEVGECFDYQFEVASKAADRGSCEVGPNASLFLESDIQNTQSPS